MPDRLSELRLNIDPLQTALSIGFMMPELIGHKVLPYYIVPSMSFKAPIYGYEAFKLVDARRALRSKPKQVEFAVDYTTEQLEEFALSAPLDRLEIEEASVAGIDARGRARGTAQRMVVLNREKAIADLINTDATYAAGMVTTVSVKWDTDTGDPFNDLLAVMDAIRQKVGVLPNNLEMGWSAWTSARGNPNVINKMPGGTGADRTTQTVSMQQFSDYLNMPYFNVGTAAYHDGTDFVDMWPDNVHLSYVDPNPTEREAPTFGFTATRRYGEVDGVPLLGIAGDDLTEQQWVSEMWYMEQLKPWIAKNDAGYLLKATNTP